MTRENSICREEFHNAFQVMVGAELQRKVVLCDKATVQSTSRLACNVAMSTVDALTSLSPRHLRAMNAIQDKMPELTAAFLKVVAASAFKGTQLALKINKGELIKVVKVDGSRHATTPDDALSPEPKAIGLEDWAGEIAGQTILEKEFGIPRSTLHLWQRKNSIVALRKGQRNHVYPLAQFLDGRPVTGIAEVLSILTSHRRTWLWLIQPSAALGGKSPIEMLRADLVDDVLVAARDFALDCN